MQLGFATPLATDAQQYLKVRTLGVNVCYLDTIAAASWDHNLNSSNWHGYFPGATTTLITCPILVGPQTGSPLTGSGSGQTTSPQNPSNVTTPTTMTLAAVGAGTWDAQFTTMFNYIATVAPSAILRIGHEQYGNGWYPWNGAALTDDYASAYKRLVGIAKTASSSFRFDWNGNVAYASYDPTVAFPKIGGSYVDYMTCDVYDGFDPGGAAGWAAYQAAVLTNALNYAVASGKPFGIPELGTFAIGYSNGYGDDPAWLLAAYNWLRANQQNIAYVGWFQNFGGDPTTVGGGALQRNPNLAAVFTSLFGAWAQQLVGVSPRFVSPAGTDRKRVHS
jgi:hypothetical protein